MHAGTGYVWIVDPLDGTRNYASGIPFFSTVIGMALDGEVLVGVNYDPVRGDLFEAERGGGAFLNGQRVTVSARTELAESIIGTDLSYNNQGAANGLQVVREIWPGMQTARIMGSAALGLSYAAAGRTDLYFHHQLEPWDQVAGLLLVEEAGGVVTGRRAGLYSEESWRRTGPCTPSSCVAPTALQRRNRGVEPGPAFRFMRRGNSARLRRHVVTDPGDADFDQPPDVIDHSGRGLTFDQPQSRHGTSIDASHSHPSFRRGRRRIQSPGRCPQDDMAGRPGSFHP